MIWLNSKIDYIKPFKTSLTVSHGSSNGAPGRPSSPYTQVHSQISSLSTPARQQTPDIQTSSTNNVNPQTLVSDSQERSQTDSSGARQSHQSAPAREDDILQSSPAREDIQLSKSQPNISILAQLSQQSVNPEVHANTASESDRSEERSRAELKSHISKLVLSAKKRKSQAQAESEQTKRIKQMPSSVTSSQP